MSLRQAALEMLRSAIFGSNALLTVPFLLATVVSGQPVLPHSQKSDLYLIGLGMLLTAMYVTRLIFRLRLQVARMGIDLLIVLLLCALAMGRLFVIAHH